MEHRRQIDHTAAPARRTAKRILALVFAVLLTAACGCTAKKSGDYALTCTFTVECTSILDHIEDLDPDKLEVLPADGIIIAKTEVGFNEGESVYDILRRLTAEKGVQMEASYTPNYQSAYVEGINNLYEFDCGALSGWTYSVNGVFPHYGCSSYYPKDGDDILWHYTCEWMPELD